MANKEYIVSVNVSFITPIDVTADSESAAAKKAIPQFTKQFDEFKKNLNDIADLNIDIDYVECQEC